MLEKRGEYRKNAGKTENKRIKIKEKQAAKKTKNVI